MVATQHRTAESRGSMVLVRWLRVMAEAWSNAPEKSSSQLQSQSQHNTMRSYRKRFTYWIAHRRSTAPIARTGNYRNHWFDDCRPGMIQYALGLITTAYWRGLMAVWIYRTSQLHAPAFPGKSREDYFLSLVYVVKGASENFYLTRIKGRAMVCQWRSKSNFSITLTCESLWAIGLYVCCSITLQVDR